MSVTDIPNEDLADTISNSLSGVFDTMLSFDCSQKSCREFSGKAAEVPDLGGDELKSVYVGSVGFVGDIHGVVYLFMKEHFVNAAAKKITGLDDEDIDYEIVSDVCGELTNMFGGSIKNTLADLGYDSVLTIPTVLSGDELFIATMSVQKHLRLDFISENNEVVADFVLAEPMLV